MEFMSKKAAGTAHISSRCSDEQKERWTAMAEQLGYSNFSEFLCVVLDGMADQYLDEEWACRLVHISGDRIIGAGPTVDNGGARNVASAFPVVAPDRFWRHIERLTRDEAA